MFNLTEEQKSARAKKIAFDQGISEEEASELVDILMGGEFFGGESEFGNETENIGEENFESYETLENEAIDQDFDLQMNHDAMGAEDLHSAETQLTNTIAKLRKTKKAKKTAELPQAQVDPQQEYLDRLMMRAQEENPDVDPTRHQYAQEMFNEMNQQNAAPGNEDEDAQIYNQLLTDNDPRNRMAKLFAKLADPRFGVPKKEGKLYRSNINPRIFKSAFGKKYILKLSAPPEEYVEQGFSEPAAPMQTQAPAPEQAPVTGPQQQAENIGQEYNLGEAEKQRLAQIIQDAEGNGSSFYRQLGLVAGFIGAPELKSVAASQEEKTEIEKAFNEGAAARGGSSPSGGTPSPAAPVTPPAAPAAPAV